MKPIDITGDRYGRLVALSRAPNKGRRTRWLFRCDCGSTKEIGLESIRGSLVNSCGCIRAEATRDRSLVHGHATGREHTRTYRAWLHAKERCFNPNIERFPIYGGRGITMCERWAASFENFLADMGECPAGLTIERNNTDGHYEPGNCRWATDREQRRSRRDNVFVQVEDQKMILKDYAAFRKVNYKSLHGMMQRRHMTAIEVADEILSR